jgi:hypothetical protein
LPVRSADVKLNPGGGANITGKHTASPGEDAHPLPDDFPAFVPSYGEGRQNIVGYVDAQNPLVAGIGERRTYARDTNGTIVNTIWQFNDGSVLVMNDSCMTAWNPDGTIASTNGTGTSTIKPSGEIDHSNTAGGNVTVLASGVVNINGVTFSLTGDVSSPANISAATSVSAPSVKAAGKELAGHNHNITSGSSSPGPTGPNN